MKWEGGKIEKKLENTGQQVTEGVEDLKQRQRKEKVRHEKEKKIGKRRNDERNNMPDLMISYIYKISLVHDNTC